MPAVHSLTPADHSHVVKALVSHDQTELILHVEAHPQQLPAEHNLSGLSFAGQSLLAVLDPAGDDQTEKSLAVQKPAVMVLDAYTQVGWSLVEVAVVAAHTLMEIHLAVHSFAVNNQEEKVQEKVQAAHNFAAWSLPGHMVVDHRLAHTAADQDQTAQNFVVQVLAAHNLAVHGGAAEHSLPVIGYRQNCCHLELIQADLTDYSNHKMEFDGTVDPEE